MSSNQPDDRAAGRTRHRRRAAGKDRWFNIRSLRVRVLAILIGLLAVGFLFVGTVTVLTLDHFQVKQLDDRLSAADNRFRRDPGQRQPPEGFPAPTGDHPTDIDRLRSLFPAGQSTGTLGARISNGAVSDAGTLDEHGDPQPLPEAQRQIIARLPADGEKYTRDLGPDLGSYRLVAKRLDNGEVLVSGLPMQDVETAKYLLIAIEIGVGFVALVIATVGGAAIIKVALRPLTRVAATARRVTELPLHEGEVGPLERVPRQDTDPRSEVGQVGAALNRLLGHVGSALAARQASETRLRRFVADASHELRTPLAAIRGYTELTRRHRTSTPPQVTDALDRVEAAAGRMTTLVEDLLLLARLDAKRPLASEPVDLSAMVIEAVTDAHVAGPGHRWRLNLPEEEVVTIGDQARLHQVVANLLANARTHTPAGTTVTVGLVPAEDHVGIRVVDDGPGIQPDLVPRLFERFARGDGSRSRSTGSTGLGLAIVDAVVRAHGGTVWVTSVPGHTEFVVRLPAAGSQTTPSNDTTTGQSAATALVP